MKLHFYRLLFLKLCAACAPSQQMTFSEKDGDFRNGGVYEVDDMTVSPCDNDGSRSDRNYNIAFKDNPPQRATTITGKCVEINDGQQQRPRDIGIRVDFKVPADVFKVDSTAPTNQNSKNNFIQAFDKDDKQVARLASAREEQQYVISGSGEKISYVLIIPARGVQTHIDNLVVEWNTCNTTTNTTTPKPSVTSATVKPSGGTVPSEEPQRPTRVKKSFLQNQKIVIAIVAAAVLLPCIVALLCWSSKRQRPERRRRSRDSGNTRYYPSEPSRRERERERLRERDRPSHSQHTRGSVSSKDASRNTFSGRDAPVSPGSKLGSRNALPTYGMSGANGKSRLPPLRESAAFNQSDTGFSRRMGNSQAGGTVRGSQAGGTVRGSQAGGTVRGSQAGSFRGSQAGATMRGSQAASLRGSPASSPTSPFSSRNLRMTVSCPFTESAAGKRRPAGRSALARLAWQT